MLCEVELHFKICLYGTILRTKIDQEYDMDK